MTPRRAARGWRGWLAICPGSACSSRFGSENLIAVIKLARPNGAERDVYGFETLTLAPLDRSLVDLSLLSEWEIDWVDGYHIRVRDAVGPLVDPATRSWLDGATAPLRS